MLRAPLRSLRMPLSAVAIVLPPLAAGGAPAQAADLPAVAPAAECTALLDRDFTGIDGAPARLHGAEVVDVEGKGPTCVVRGYVASDVNFEVRMPVEGWTQRFLMLGCGGYCGGVDADPASNQKRATAGCAPLASGAFVTASTDLGHTRSAEWYSDGLWALGNPEAVVDFAYAGMHKTTLIAKELIEAYYGQPAAKNYYVGCSDGGREGLQEVQRFPDDYDAVVIGAPTIDEVTTNTVYHAWGIRTNTAADGGPILTADKIPALAAAVSAACGDAGGLVQDPRACDFEAKALVCTGAETADCLTEEQAAVVEKLWEGPVDETGAHLAARAMPKGSELAWIKTMVPSEGVTEMSHLTLGDGAWSYDFPNYLASFDAPTGITYANMAFDRATFDRLHELSGLYDPTNPDLSAFAARGGKLIVWTGWADSGVSPYIALNYYTAVRETMGAERADEFVTFYGLPGVYHCGGGPRTAQTDFLTPMMAWAEDGVRPDRVVVEFTDADGAVTASRPAFPYPSQVEHDGAGDLAAAEAWTRADLPAGLPERFDWVGLANYVPGKALWCGRDGDTFACTTR